MSTVASTIGALAAFLIGKRFLRQYIRENMLNKVKLFQAIDLALEHNGFKMAFLLLISYIIPHPIFPYVMSLTSISAHDLVLAHVLGMPLGLIFPIMVGISLPSISMVGNSE